MAVFDQYLIVDWSANNTPKRGTDSIWLCLVDAGHSILRLENPSTRHEAMSQIAEVFDAALAAGKRLFSGFDFGFGYPAGASSHIAGAADWQAVWSRLHELVVDEHSNKSNRFEAASRINRECFSDVDGPFWGHPHQHTGRYEGLGTHKPVYTDVSERRIVDTIVAGAQPVWKLAYTGSVGSQTLLGIPRLEALRAAYGNALSIWPFETHFDENLGSPLVVAEVYPSLFPVESNPGEIKDCAQVRTVAQNFAQLDQASEFKRLLSCPTILTDEQKQNVLTEEGWIVGAGHQL